MPYNRNGAMRMVHILGKKNGFDHEALGDVAASLFRLKTPSLKELSNSQLSQFIDHLKGNRTGELIRIPDAASVPQRRKIFMLALELGMVEQDGTDPHERLEGFISRQVRGKRKPSDLTTWEASNVIEGLKHLIENADAAK